MDHKNAITRNTITLPETNIAPENQCLKMKFPFGMEVFQGRTASFREVFFSNWMFPKIGVPENGWFLMENLVKVDDLGGNTPIFGNTQLLNQQNRPRIHLKKAGCQPPTPHPSIRPIRPLPFHRSHKCPRQRWAIVWPQLYHNLLLPVVFVAFT